MQSDAGSTHEPVWQPSQRYPDASVRVLDQSFAKYRLNLAAVERLADGCRWCEGPVWFGDGRYLLWSDIPNNRILKWEEETGAVSAKYLGETDWIKYDFPPYDGPATHRLAQFRGQRQKWFALRFTGSDDEIDPLTPRNGQPAEFDSWRWERLDRVADLVVPFRRDAYRMVAQVFAEFAR